MDGETGLQSSRSEVATFYDSGVESLGSAAVMTVLRTVINVILLQIILYYSMWTFLTSGLP